MDSVRDFFRRWFGQGFPIDKDGSGNQVHSQVFWKESAENEIGVCDCERTTFAIT